MLQGVSDAKIHAASHHADTHAAQANRRNERPATPFDALLDELAPADQPAPQDASDATPANTKSGVPPAEAGNGVTRAASVEHAAPPLVRPTSETPPEQAPAEAVATGTDEVATIPAQPSSTILMAATDAGDGAKAAPEAKPREPAANDDGEPQPAAILAIVGTTVLAKPIVPAPVPTAAADPPASPPTEAHAGPVSGGGLGTGPLLALLARLAPSRPTADRSPDDGSESLAAPSTRDTGPMAADAPALPPSMATSLAMRSDVRANMSVPGDARHEARVEFASDSLDTGGNGPRVIADPMLLPTFNAPAQAAAPMAPAVGTPATPSVPLAPAAPVPLADLAVEIAGQALAGRNRFEIRLDPPELGRIEVKLDVHRDGRIASHIVVDRADTLDLLRSDASALQRALQDAGLKTTDNGLQFSLRDQGGEQQQPPSPAVQPVTDDAGPAMPDPAPLRLFVRDGGIDIRV